MHRTVVYIIDDDPKTEWFLTDELNSEVSIKAFQDGVEGLLAIKTCCPDLLLLNIQMPRADGVWVLEQLKKARIELRIIVVTRYQERYARKLLGTHKPLSLLAGDWTREDLCQEITKFITGENT